MELDGSTLGLAGTTLLGTLGSAWGAIKFILARVDKQFAEAEAKAEKAREEIKVELKECDTKHEKCEADRLKIWEEVINLRAEVKSVVRSQGIETERRAAEGPR